MFEKSILVTGGAGFIGANFVSHFAKAYPHYRIIDLDALTYAAHPAVFELQAQMDNVVPVQGNICDTALIQQLLRQYSITGVIHFAAESHVDRSIENPEVFLQTNILGTACLMDACRKYGIGRYHQVSTDEVYGDLPIDRPDLLFTENTPLHTSSPYRQAPIYSFLRITAPMICRSRLRGVRITTVRITSRKNSFRS